MAEYSADYIEEKAQEIIALYKDKFEISDIFETITIAMDAVKHFNTLSGPEKEDAAYELICKVVDGTDAPGPDFITDRVVKWLARPAIKWLYGKFGVGKE